MIQDKGARVALDSLPFTIIDVAAARLVTQHFDLCSALLQKCGVIYIHQVVDISPGNLVAALESAQIG